jgi:S-adenosyl methyltransferase
VVKADIRDPDSILANPDVTRLIDFAQPVAVLFVASCTASRTRPIQRALCVR